MFSVFGLDEPQLVLVNPGVAVVRSFGSVELALSPFVLESTHRGVDSSEAAKMPCEM